MTMIDIEEDKEEKVSKPWTPRVITGGKGPPEDPVKNWLSKFPLDTTFTCRSKNSKDVDLNLYCVVFQHPEVTLLAWRLPDGKILEVHVDPERFSDSFEHVTVLGKLPVAQEEEKEDDSDEQRNHLRSGDVVLHEAVQGVDQVVSPEEGPDLPSGD